MEATLPPPPLETAAGTRALQRFDLGRVRPKPIEEEELPSEIEIIVSTVKMPVPDSVRNLPIADAYAPHRIITAAMPKAKAPLAPRPFVTFGEAVWALAASVSLFALGSVGSALVYVILFR